MKVSEILSTATIGSSRALSTFAAIIIVIVWSDTPPKKIPLISFIDVHPGWHYAVALGLLLYMTIAHFVNWRHDSINLEHEDAQTRIDGTKETREKATTPPPMATTSDDVILDPFAAPIERFTEERQEANERLHRSRSLVTYGMHMTVPFGLAGTAAISLMVKVYDCWLTGCC